MNNNYTVTTKTNWDSTTTTNPYKYYTTICDKKGTKYGLDGEDNVIKFMQARYPNWVITPSNRAGQRHHIDYTINTGNETYNIDYKEWKHIFTKRGDEFSIEDKKCITLEFVNDYGYKGWIFAYEKVHNHLLQFHILDNDNDDAYLIIRSDVLTNLVNDKYLEIYRKEGVNHKNTRKLWKIHTRRNPFQPELSYISRTMNIPVSFITENTNNYKIIKTKQ